MVETRFRTDGSLALPARLLKGPSFIVAPETVAIFLEISGELIRLHQQMLSALTIAAAARQDQRISETVEREQARLLNFIRKRVPDRRDAEDILQEVFYELVEMYRFAEPVERMTAWLFRVARNRIIDLFRKRQFEPLRDDAIGVAQNGEPLSLEDLLPSSDAGPEQAYARKVLIEELESALDELPEEHREVFITHELEGRSFKELAEQTGLSANTLRLRKHYAVLRLRQRLQAIRNEFTRGPKTR